MAALRKKCVSFDIDLAFDRASEDLLLEIVDLPTRLVMTDAEPWLKDLTSWIQIIRSDYTAFCPDLIRRTSAVSMGLKFTDDLTMTALNSYWRGKQEATDVLSFPAFDEKNILPGDQIVELGDIVVSIPRAKSQATEHHHDLIHELRWLVSHGLLHLLGWDHPNCMRLKEMLCFQEQLLGINGNL